MEFKEKVVVITGSSSGIGEGIALEYAKHGAKLVLTGRNKKNLEKVALQCKTNDASTVTQIIADLSLHDHVVKLAGEITRAYDHVDILVLNAGTTAVCSFEDHTMEDFDRIFSTNVRSYFHLTKLLINHIKKCKGSIIVMSSNVATSGVQNIMAYGMSKAALNYFTKSLAMEYAKVGVRVNGVSPGCVRTNNMAEECKLSKEKVEQVITGSAVLQPLGGIMKPSDVAKSVLFLTSSNASCISGHTLAIENGFSPWHMFPAP